MIFEGSSGEVKPKVDEPKRVAEDKPQEQTVVVGLDISLKWSEVS